MPSSIKHLAPFLVGEWRLSRRFVSLDTELTGTAAGVASFRPQPEGLTYHETVDVNYAGRVGPASRTYHYRLTALGCARVHFVDGRFFHTFDLREGRWRVEHLCGDDVYRGGFRVLNTGFWIARWRVSGPRKNLRISTLYERLSP